jgi:hypothetical protein
VLVLALVVVLSLALVVVAVARGTIRTPLAGSDQPRERGHVGAGGARIARSGRENARQSRAARRPPRSGCLRPRARPRIAPTRPPQLAGSPWRGAARPLRWCSAGNRPGTPSSAGAHEGHRRGTTQGHSKGHSDATVAVPPLHRTAAGPGYRLPEPTQNLPASSQGARRRPPGATRNKAERATPTLARPTPPRSAPSLPRASRPTTTNGTTNATSSSHKQSDHHRPDRLSHRLALGAFDPRRAGRQCSARSQPAPLTTRPSPRYRPCGGPAASRARGMRRHGG